MNDSRDLYALFGNPVSQSLSPLMMNAAFAKLNLHARYAAFRVADAADIRPRMATLHIRGASVTIPHKVAVMDGLDAVTESAAAIGAVNTIIRTGDTLAGDLQVVAGGTLTRFAWMDSTNHQKFLNSEPYSVVFEADSFAQKSVSQTVTAAGRQYLLFVNNNSATVKCWVRLVLE